MGAGLDLHGDSHRALELRLEEEPRILMLLEPWFLFGIY